MKTKLRLLIALSLPLAVPSLNAIINPGVFWAADDVNNIERIDFDGTSNRVELVSSANAGTPGGIRLDTTNSHLYFINRNADTLLAQEIDGVNPTGTLKSVGSIPGSPQYLALDVSGGKVYWTDQTCDCIKRAAVNFASPTGSLGTIETVVNKSHSGSFDITNPTGIDLVTIGGTPYVYWAEGDNNAAGKARVMRANISGSIPTILVDQLVTATAGGGTVKHSHLSSPHELKIDQINDPKLVCWADNDNPNDGTSDDNVSCANLDGTNPRTFYLKNNESLFGLALDPSAMYMYVGNVGPDEVERVPYDPSGSLPQMETADGFNFVNTVANDVGDAGPRPFSVEVVPVPEPSTYALMAGIFGLALTVYVRKRK